MKLAFASFLLLASLVPIGGLFSSAPAARAQTTAGTSPNTVFKAENLDISIGTDPSGNGVKSEYRVVVNEPLKIKYYLNWGPSTQNGYPALDSTINTERTSAALKGFYAGFNYADFDIPRCYSYGGSANCVLNATSKVSTSLPVLEGMDVPYATLIKDGNFPLKSASSTPVGEPLGSKGFAVFPILKLDSNMGSNDYGLSKNPAKLIVKVYANEASRKASFDKDGLQYIAGQQETGQAVNVTARGRSSTQASSLTSFLNDLFTGIAQFFIGLTYVVFTKVISPLLEGLLSIRVYTDQFVNVIYPGWEVLRNVVNIYFIIAIIAIALGTLFRLESYQAKHLLVQLIIAALTVNFSLVIGQAILGVADTVQSQFLPNSSTVIRDLGKNLMPANIQDIVNANPLTQDSFFGSAITTLFLMSMAVGSFLVFAAIAIFLIIRIIMLWILLMVSPLAYAARVLPSTQSLSGQWWGEFLKYAFFTPVMAFFLNLTAIIAVKYEFVFRDINSRVVAGDPQLKDLSTLIFATASNILLLVFLVAAIQVADKFGIYGANVITTTVKTGMFAPFAGAGGAAALAGKGAQWLGGDVAGGWLQKKYNNWTAGLAEGSRGKKIAYGMLHLPTYFKSLRKDSGEELERSKSLTSAAALSIKRQTPGFRRQGEDPLALYNEHQGKELMEERRGEASSSEQDEVQFAMQLWRKARDGDKDAQLMLPEQLRRMFKNHNMNEFVENFGEEFDMEFTGGRKLQYKDLRYNKNNLGGVLDYMKANGALSHHVHEDFQKRLGSLAYDSKDFTGAEMTWTDEHGHAHTIKREYDPATVSFKTVGIEDYNALRDFASLEIHNRGLDVLPSDDERTVARKTREAGRIVHAVETGDNTYGYGALQSTFRSSAQARALHGGNGFNAVNYENAMHDQTKILEKQINLSKQKGIQQLDQWWESQISKDSAGNTVFGSSGKYTFTHLTSGHEYIAGRDGMADRVKEFYLPLVVRKQAQLRENLKDSVLEEARAKGRYVADLERETSEQEYRNLRLAYMAVFKDPKQLDNAVSAAGGLGAGTKADYDRVVASLRAELSRPGLVP